MISRRWSSFVAAMTLILTAVMIPASAATTGDTPDGSRAGLGWVALGLAVVAIIGILVLTRRRNRRDR